MPLAVRNGIRSLPPGSPEGEQRANGPLLCPGAGTCRGAIRVAGQCIYRNGAICIDPEWPARARRKRDLPH